jgi:hypothetical protein
MKNALFTLDMIDLNELWYGAIVPVADQYQEVALPVLSSMVRMHGLDLFSYYIADDGGYQKLAIDSRPTHTQLEKAYMYARFGKFGRGVGSGLDSLRLSTGRDVTAAVDRGFKAYSEHVLRELLKVVLTNPGTSNAGYGLFNGEFSAEEKITAPPRHQMNTFAANHSHYIVSGGTTIALDDITEGKQTIRHHGHAGPILAMVNSNVVRQFENLAAFTANPMVRSPISDAVAVMGFKDRWTQLGVEWLSTEMMPDGYVLMAETSESDDERLIVQFEPPNLRGLRLMPGPINDYPIVESFFESFAGWKVWKRGAAVAMQIKASGTYENPSLDL